MIDALLVEVLKGLPSVKSLCYKRDKKTGKPTGEVVDYEDNDFVIVGEAPVERGTNDLAMSVESFGTVYNNGRNELGKANTNMVANGEIGLIVRKMNDNAERVTKAGKQQKDADGKPIKDTAYWLILKDILGLHQNIKPFRDIIALDPKPKFRIESINIAGPSEDSSDEGPHYHHFRFEFTIDFDAKEFLTTTSN